MNILIHACPQRMWYVKDFLIPMLQEQGADNIEVWNDIRKEGNLKACMDSFAARIGDGGTWHIQDDVLPARDFLKQCKEHDEGLVYGFCCRNFDDRLDAYGEVYVPDAWNSFQCVRIPNAYARECAAWVRGMKWQNESPSVYLSALWKLGKGDDSFFHEFMSCRHPYETALNLKPNIVEHIDYIIGGTSLHWRDNIACAVYFEDKDLIEDIKERVKRYQER